MSAEEWTGFMVTHPYMGPVPAFFYAAGQLMDFGVHSWDIRQGTGRARTASTATPPTCWSRSCSRSGKARCRPTTVGEPFTIGIRVGGRNGGDYRVTSVQGRHDL